MIIIVIINILLLIIIISYYRDELSKFIGDEISRTMAEQKALELRYGELIGIIIVVVVIIFMNYYFYELLLLELRASMKGMINKNKYKEIQDEIQDISRALR